MSKLEDWAIFEEDVAEYLNGKRQAGSGNSCIAFKKGDIKSEEYLVECKCTGKDCYTLSSKTFGKIINEAINSFRIPLFAARTNNSDYFVGLTLDFPDVEYKDEIDSAKSIKLDGRDSFLVKEFKVDNVPYQVVCWKVKLKEKMYD